MALDKSLSIEDQADDISIHQTGAYNKLDSANKRGKYILNGTIGSENSNEQRTLIEDTQSNLKVAGREAGEAINDYNEYIRTINPALLGAETTAQLSDQHAELLSLRSDSMRTYDSLERSKNSLVDTRPDQIPETTTRVTRGVDEEGFEYELIETVSVNNSGEELSTEQQARSENATTHTPMLDQNTSNNAPGETVTKSNADPIPTSPFGTTAPGDVTPSILTGNGISADDQGITDDGEFIQQNGVSIASAFFDKIDTQDNPLTKYGQYTYNIGLYLQTRQDYQRMIATGAKTTQGLKKILQSGGNSIEEDAMFPDVFIEDLEVESILPGKNSGPHNVVAINFDIIEPYGGFTFLPKLRQMAKRVFDEDSAGGVDDSPPNFAKQHYLLVIKFIGYDENGKQTTLDNDPQLTKYVPFIFTKITTRVRSGAAVYNCRAVCPNYQIGITTQRATIPFNVELVGNTLNDVFNGPKGIIDALNKQQKELQKKASYEYPDTYKITFAGNIGEFKVKQSEAARLIKKHLPLKSNTTQAENVVTSPGIDTSNQTFSTVAGMPLMQFIDLMIRSSDYITKQQKAIIDPKTKEMLYRNESNPFLQWYTVGVNTIPGPYDRKRGDYSYTIEYIISPRQINDTYSSFFNKADYRGVHKRYNYWFTGENTEVLDYEQEINTQFFIAMGGRIPEETRATDPEKESLQTKAFVNDKGLGGMQPGDYTSPANFVAGVLYSPVDFASAKLKILGDPDYLQQNEIFYRSGEVFDAFMPDGSINYDSGEVLFEINFKTMTDYTEDGGAQLLTPELTSNKSGTSGIIYRVIGVKTQFSKGLVTQELEGLIREFDPSQLGDKDQGRESNIIESSGRADDVGFTTEQLQRISPTYSLGPDFTPVGAGSQVPGSDGITSGVPGIGPDFTPVGAGSQVPGSDGITSGITSTGPNFTPVGAGSQVPGIKAIDTAGSIAPDFTPVGAGSQVPGERGVSENIAPFFPNQPAEGPNPQNTIVQVLLPGDPGFEE